MTTSLTTPPLTQLGDGISLLQWPRNYTEYESKSQGTGLVRCSAHQQAAMTTNAQLLRRMARLDRMYGGSLPGFFPREEKRLTLAEESFARRRFYKPLRYARHYLPYSLVRRVRAIEALAPQRIVLRDDVDGLSLALASAHQTATNPGTAASMQVVVIEPDAQRREWLQAELPHWPGAKETLDIIEEQGALKEDTEFDLTLVQAGHPRDTAEALSWAYRMVGAGGHILVSLHAPWDTSFVKATKAAGIEVTDQWREIDVPVLPGGFVMDGSGDIVVLHRSEDFDEAQLPIWQGDAAAVIDELPYHWLDFDALASSVPGSLDNMLDTVALYSPRPEFKRSMLKESQRELATWYDTEGFGFSAELNIEEAHLLVTLLPYDSGLEYALQCAAFHTLGDRHTRVRPHRTEYFQQESIIV